MHELRKLTQIRACEALSVKTLFSQQSYNTIILIYLWIKRLVCAIDILRPESVVQHSCMWLKTIALFCYFVTSIKEVNFCNCLHMVFLVVFRVWICSFLRVVHNSSVDFFNRMSRMVSIIKIRYLFYLFNCHALWIKCRYKKKSVTDKI